MLTKVSHHSSQLITRTSSSIKKSHHALLSNNAAHQSLTHEHTTEMNTPQHEESIDSMSAAPEEPVIHYIGPLTASERL